MGFKSGADRYDYVTQRSETAKAWFTNREKALFHLHNNFGLNASYQRLIGALGQKVRNGEIRSGWLLAYDDHVYYNGLRELAHNQKRVKGNELEAVLQAYRELINRGWEALVEEGLIETNPTK